MKEKTGPIKVAINFVDGSYREDNERLGILATHDRLVHSGLQGKALIHAVLSDDMRPPPTRVTISFYSDGKLQEIVIPYR